MISKPTVLILGAGASKHLRYPVGSSLLNEIVSLPAGIFQKIYAEKEIRSFQLRLSRDGCYSIDEFLEKNRQFIVIGKSYIAYCLNKYEVENNLFPPHNSGWYQYLFNRMLVPSDSVSQFSDNKITIITFNYDRSLEVYLHNVIKHHYNISEEESLNILRKINIIHPHGILGEYPEIPYTGALGGEIDSPEKVDLLKKITDSIKIIHEMPETDDAFCSHEFQISNKALQEAEKIYFLGFGFHEDNIRRFRFFSPESLKSREVLASNSGLHKIEIRELINRLNKYGFREGLFTSRGIGCESFFKAYGILE